MRSLLIVFAVVGVAVARPGYLGLGLGALHAPAGIVSPLAYTNVAAPPHIAYAAPHVASSQYHAQDELGQYSYGYAGGPSAKSEVKTWDGVTRGGYSYVDAEGKVQSVNYVADAVNGFRVAATNLPVAPVAPEPIPAEPLVAPLPVEDTAEVAAAKEAHFVALAEAKAAAEAAPEEPAVVAVEAEPVAVAPAAVTYSAVTPAALAPISYSAVAPISYSAVDPFSYSTVAAPAPISYSTIAAPAPIAPISYSAVAPAFAPFSYSAVAPAPAHISYSTIAAPAPIAPISYSAVAAAPAHIAYAAPHVASSQYHAQDELGQYSYGYAGGPSAKSEVKSWDGVTRGGYSYVDAEGKVQTVNYVADAVNGFRVAATNLPVAPVVPAVPDVPIVPEAPILETVPDSPEIVEAKAAHFAAHEEAKARLSA